MKINLRKDNFNGSIPEFFQNLIINQTTAFAKEYDIDEKYVRTYITCDEGKKLFCHYLSKKRILTMKPYVLSSYDQVIADGFDIVENSLYTKALIKYS